MTAHHDLHMARLRIARLEEENAALKELLDQQRATDLARVDVYADGYPAIWLHGITQPASSPRPAPETKKDPAQDEGSGRG